MINLIVTSKKPQLQGLDQKAAAAHCERGASVWNWAYTGGAPDVVLAASGDVPTREILVAASLLRERAPDLAVRVVNVVALLSLQPAEDHPTGLSASEFDELFPGNCPVIFAFHGYPMVIHDVLHGRGDTQRFHVHGYAEEGTTTTPFDMLVLNEMSRFHLAKDALERCGRDESHFDMDLQRHREWVALNGKDLPSVEDWTWIGRHN